MVERDRGHRRRRRGARRELKDAGADPDPFGAHRDRGEEHGRVRAPRLGDPDRVEAGALGLGREPGDVVRAPLPVPEVDPDPHPRRLARRARSEVVTRSGSTIANSRSPTRARTRVPSSRASSDSTSASRCNIAVRSSRPHGTRIVTSIGNRGRERSTSSIRSSSPSPVRALIATAWTSKRVEARALVFGDPVDLVERDHLGDVRGSDLREDDADGVDLAHELGRRRVGHVKDQRRPRDLLERGAERLDEVVRQLAHEPDRVRDRRGAAARQAEAPDRRVERREELVRHDDVGVRQRVHERRLAGVRVAGDRDLRDAGALAARALRRRAGARGPSGPCAAWLIRRRMCWRSVSSFVSPPPIRAPMPPPERLIASPHPRSRGRR